MINLQSSKENNIYNMICNDIGLSNRPLLLLNKRIYRYKSHVLMYQLIVFLMQC